MYERWITFSHFFDCFLRLVLRNPDFQLWAPESVLIIMLLYSSFPLLLITLGLWVLIGPKFVTYLLLHYPMLKTLDTKLYFLTQLFFSEKTRNFSNIDKLRFFYPSDFLSGLHLMSAMSSRYLSSFIWTRGVSPRQSQHQVRFHVGLSARCFARNTAVTSSDNMAPAVGIVTSFDLRLSAQTECA